MILVDSSAFIEYYRARGMQKVRQAVAEAIADDQVAVNGMIQVEIVAYAATPADRKKLESDFSAFHWLELTAQDFGLAVDLGCRLRGRGITVPPTDLIIAASALRAEATLYHVDGHYNLVARHSDLRARNLAP